MPCYDGMTDNAEMKRREIARTISRLTDMLCRMCKERQKESKDLPLDIAEWYAVHQAWDEIREKRGMDALKHNHGDV